MVMGDMAALKTAGHLVLTDHREDTMVAAHHNDTTMDEPHPRRQKEAEGPTGATAVVFLLHPARADTSFHCRHGLITALMAATEEGTSLHQATRTYQATRVVAVHVDLANQTTANKGEDHATQATRETATQTSADPTATTGDRPATLEDSHATAEMGGHAAGVHLEERKGIIEGGMTTSIGGGRSAIPSDGRKD